eukprot:COSAG01_NODE_25398_length_746_cov_1.316847_1_plen_99_part_01
MPPKLWGSIKEVVPDTPTKGRGASTPSLLARGPPVYDPRSSMHYYALIEPPRRFKTIVLHDGILPPKPWGSIRGFVPDTPTKGRGAGTPRFLARGRPVY